MADLDAQKNHRAGLNEVDDQAWFPIVAQRPPARGIQVTASVSAVTFNSDLSNDGADLVVSLSAIPVTDLDDSGLLLMIRCAGSGAYQLCAHERCQAGPPSPPLRAEPRPGIGPRPRLGWIQATARRSVESNR